MTSTLSDEVLRLGQEVVQGRAPKEQLVGLLEQLAGVTAETHERFSQQGTDHPELTPQAVRFMLKALGRLEGAIYQAQAMLESGDREALGYALQVAYEALSTIRGLQTGHQLALEQGPAFHPYLNRVLLHMGYFFRGGYDTRDSLALMADLPAFLEEMELRLPAGMAQMTALAQACHQFRDWLEAPTLDPERLGEVQARLLAASQALSQSLSAHYEQELSHPTAYPPVNLVLLAADQLLTGPASLELFQQSLEQCRQLLDRHVPAGCEPALQQAADVVKRILADLARPAEPEQQDERLAALTRATEELTTWMQLAERDSILDLVHQEGLGAAPRDGLPPLLSQLLQLGEGLLSGQEVGQQLEQGLTALDALLNRTLTAGNPGDDSVRLAFEELELAHSALASLLESHQADDLELAHTHMLAASEALQEASGRSGP